MPRTSTLTPSRSTAILRRLVLLVALLAIGGPALAAVRTDATPSSPEGHGGWLSLQTATSTYGGTCGSSCDSGGSDDDEPDDPRPLGGSYWRTTDRVLRSYDPGVADLIEHLANYDDRTLSYAFEISERTVRSVGFSGGYADYFRLSIGGETDRTRTRRVEKVLDPYEALKVYQRQETRRYTVYGTRYQDYDDGSRRVVGESSGPYTTSVTKTGYVTYALR